MCRNTRLARIGYAIIDRLYVYGGTPYIVADNSATLTEAQAIVGAGQAKAGALQVVTVSEAREIFGRFVHKVPGVAVSFPRLRVINQSKGLSADNVH